MGRHRGRLRARGRGRGQFPDSADGCCGDLVESGGGLAAELIVAVPGHGAGCDGGDRAERPGQVTGDRAEDVLIACAEDDVRAHAGGCLGYAPGDELGVPLTPTFRLAVGHVPFPVVQRGRPARVRVVLRAGMSADREAPGGVLIPGGVRDHGRAVTVRQHDHVRWAPRGGGGYLQQARQRSYPHRAWARVPGKPSRQQDLPMHRYHRSGALSERRSGARGQHLGGTLIGAQPAGFPGGIGPGHVPRILSFRPRIRYLDPGGHHETGRRCARLKGAQPGPELQPAELQ
jgi:hypothetical protein